MTADLDIGDLTEIIAENRNTLVFRFKDGRKAVKRWQDRSRAKSWTPEMKEATRQKAMERNRHNDARVSTDSEEQLTSYEAQVDYYTKYIRSNPDWEFVDVYTDEGILHLR